MLPCNKIRGLVGPFWSVCQITARGWRAIQGPQRIQGNVLVGGQEGSPPPRINIYNYSFSKPTVYWLYVVNIRVFFFTFFRYIMFTMTYWYGISRNFSKDLILALFAMLFSSLKLYITKNTACLEIMHFIIWLIEIAKNTTR